MYTSSNGNVFNNVPSENSKFLYVKRLRHFLYFIYISCDQNSAHEPQAARKPHAAHGNMLADLLFSSQLI